MPKSRPLVERFWEKVDKNGPIPKHMPHLGQCWLWTARTNVLGYGNIREGIPSKRTLLSHRVSWELHNESIPEGLYALHSCDNPTCVNPMHLFLGTDLDNMQDRDAKKRRSPPRGEKSGTAKLNEDKVIEIRRDYVRGSSTQGQIALSCKYGVGQAQISRILRGESWK